MIATAPTSPLCAPSLAQTESHGLNVRSGFASDRHVSGETGRRRSTSTSRAAGLTFSFGRSRSLPGAGSRSGRNSPLRPVLSHVCGGTSLHRGQQFHCTMPTSSSLPQLSFALPVVNLWTAVAATGARQDEVLAMIQDGRLLYAWDIGSRSSGKQLVRILARSIADFQQGRTASLASRMRAGAEEFNQVLKELFPAVSYKPHGPATIRAATFTRRLCASHDHVLGLCREGSLRFAKGTKCTTGPHGSPEIEFASVVEFLRQRRIT